MSIQNEANWLVATLSKELWLVQIQNSKKLELSAVVIHTSVLQYIIGENQSECENNLGYYIKLFRDLPFNVRRPDAWNIGLFISHNLTLINMFFLSCIWTLNPSTMFVMIQRSCFFVFVFVFFLRLGKWVVELKLWISYSDLEGYIDCW